MLVLSRKLNEKIVIDGGIVVTVVKIDRNQVRLGIEAPGQRANVPRRDCRRRRVAVPSSRLGRCLKLARAAAGWRSALQERLPEKIAMADFLPRQQSEVD